MQSTHVYKVRPRKDHRGVDLISDALPFGGPWYGEPNTISNAIGYAKFYSRAHDAVIGVYNDAGEFAKQLGRFRGTRPERGLALLQCFNANCLYAARNRLQNAV
jgi:hypothetical protein